jgi:hypothetical protein
MGNLLVGRNEFLFASSTCGLYQAERFCLVGQDYSINSNDKLITFYENNQLKKGSSCSHCDSRTPYEQNNHSHRIENVINYRKQTKAEMETKWWQSESGVNDVFVQFDLEAEFLLAHIYMLFKSFPPAAMFIEKSSDYGKSWQTIVYYAFDCEESFPHVATKSLYMETPICISTKNTHSQVGFFERELVYRPLYRYRYLDPHLLSKHLKVTNVRFNFTRLLMLGDNLMTNDTDVLEKYYYSMRDLQIIGTCFCNGHSSRCVRLSNVEYRNENINNMIHGKCVCEHNTDGDNCQACLPLYNNREWRPAEYKQANECEKCECNNHADRCYFDEELFIANGKRDGGICVCLHNTEGVHCERCREGYYHDQNLPFTHPDACQRKY